jgi:Mn2+/Fe2+ NRAMP family transporter
MAKSGADYALELGWAVLIASFVAFSMQESAARLFIVGGLDFGSAMRYHFGENGKTPFICYAVATGIFLGNIALECAQFAGALSALYVVYKDETVFRVFMSILFGSVVAGILMFGEVDTISKALGLVVLLMVVTFSISAGQIAAEADPGFTEDLFKGWAGY